jgi:hypothetical protein
MMQVPQVSRQSVYNRFRVFCHKIGWSPFHYVSRCWTELLALAVTALPALLIYGPLPRSAIFQSLACRCSCADVAEPSR